MKQIEHFGYGSILRLEEIARKKKIERPLIVSSDGTFTGSGADKYIIEFFGLSGFTRFSDFTPNPKIQDVDEGITSLRASGADSVIAIGGGTAIDLAKLISVFEASGEAPLALLIKKMRISRSRLLIAIPTTSGTGSESTGFAAVYSERKKYSVEHPSMLPDYALVDPGLTLSMPELLTAVTGMDALSQGIESLWSCGSTPESSGFASEAVRLCVRYLKGAVNAGDRESREKMSLASHLSGKAINISKTTGPHAFSYYFTAHHGVPHGHAVALTLANFIRFNAKVTESDAADTRGVRHVIAAMESIYAALGVNNAEEAAAAISALMADIGLSTRLADTGFDAETEVEAFLSEVNAERLGNNPRRVTEESARDIVSSLR